MSLFDRAERLLDRLPDPRPWMILGYFAGLIALSVYLLAWGCE